MRATPEALFVLATQRRGIPTAAELRDELERLVLNDLLGAANGPEEIAAESCVDDCCLLDRLPPKVQTGLPEDQDGSVQAGIDGEDGKAEAPPPRPTIAAKLAQGVPGQAARGLCSRAGETVLSAQRIRIAATAL